MSPSKGCYFLRVLTLRSKLREPANDGINDRVEFFKFVFPLVVKALSPVVEIMDVAKTCSYKATRDIVVLALEL